MIGNFIDGKDIHGKDVCGVILDVVIVPQIVMVKKGFETIPGSILACTAYLITTATLDEFEANMLKYRTDPKVHLVPPGSINFITAPGSTIHL